MEKNVSRPAGAKNSLSGSECVYVARALAFANLNTNSLLT